jgi:hypothetical protein
MSDTKHEYRLRDDVERVVRSGLVLEGDDTITLEPTAADPHDDVLERVDGDNGSDNSTDDEDGPEGADADERDQEDS